MNGTGDARVRRAWRWTLAWMPIGIIGESEGNVAPCHRSRCVRCIRWGGNSCPARSAVLRNEPRRQRPWVAARRDRSGQHQCRCGHDHLWRERHDHVVDHIRRAELLPADDHDAAGLTIDGSGQNITISGDPTAPNFARKGLFFLPCCGGNSPLTLKHLTSAEGWGQDPGGGAVANQGTGTLTVIDSTFSNNVASGVQSYGGAIFSYGDVVVTNSTFVGNYGRVGGAINASGAISVTNSTFATTPASRVSRPSPPSPGALSRRESDRFRTAASLATRRLLAVPSWPGG